MLAQQGQAGCCPLLGLYQCPKSSAYHWELLCCSAPGTGSRCSVQTEVVAGAWQVGRSVQNLGLARGFWGFPGVVASAPNPGDSH